jgi:hypothetical protein
MKLFQKIFQRILLLAVIFTATLTSGISTAHASFLFNPVNTFSGTAPVGYLTADFTDVVGGVQLVINSNLAVGESLDPGKALYFNFNPSKSSILPNLSFQLTGDVSFCQQADVSTGTDAFKADGDGYYDINFTFTPSTKAFISGESQTYKITAAAESSMQAILQTI